MANNNRITNPTVPARCSHSSTVLSHAAISSTSHAGHADAADDGRGHGGGVARPGVEEVVQLGEERGEEGEGGARGEDALAQHGARRRAVALGEVLGVIRVPDQPGQQAQLRDHERHPACIHPHSSSVSQWMDR
jgi:hypothetical protein